MKSVLVAAVLTAALPAAALAAPQATTPPVRATPAPAPSAPSQTGAAATLPNTFDGPPAQSTQRPAARPSAPASVGSAAPAAAEPSSPAKVAAAETMLKKTIAAMQSGTPNYADMTSDLAEKVRAQAGNVLPMFAQLGALQTVTHVGAQDGAELFSVVFASAPTQWIIAQNAQGKIVALLFRPAPPPAA